MMLLLLRLTGSLKQAFAIQVILFAVAHIKGATLGAFVHALSVLVLAIGYTYVAYKTRSLVAGIVFHYFHNALLYFVQIPDRAYAGVTDNGLFYGLLWLMVGIACVITRFAADNLGARAPAELYDLDGV